MIRYLYRTEVRRATRVGCGRAFVLGFLLGPLALLAFALLR